MITMPDQIDPGTPVDVYDGHRWKPGWVLIRPAFLSHGAGGHFWSYEVYKYPKEERSVPVTFVRRIRGDNWPKPRLVSVNIKGGFHRVVDRIVDGLWRILSWRI